MKNFDNEEAGFFSDILKNNKSDKSNPNNYYILYSYIINRLGGRDAHLDTLEIGIGTNNPALVSNMGVNGRPGASLYAFKEYLTNSTIHGADVDKDILSLSGGESARLLLGKVILEAPNVLILDEPTNHMDIETIDALAAALESYQGTLIVVSHDRYFIEKFANRILYFSKHKGIQTFQGGYDEFVAKAIYEDALPQG
jgi:hypothetical protein